MMSELCANAIEAKARELAENQGHRDPDHIITCIGGEKNPIWKFYVQVAKIELAETG